MGDIDCRIISKLKSLGISIDIYKRYVDDIFVACPPINPGWEYDKVKNKMIYNSSSENIGKNSDERTAEILRDISNTIENDIKFTFDTPSMNDSGKMPVLDLAVCIDNNTVEYTFYKKKIASVYTVMRRSAVTTRCKLDTVF